MTANGSEANTRTYNFGEYTCQSDIFILNYCLYYFVVFHVSAWHCAVSVFFFFYCFVSNVPPSLVEIMLFFSDTADLVCARGVCTILWRACVIFFLGVSP